MLRILVVEDSPANMLLAATMLASAGHSALRAERADTAIEIARREHPDLILMDIQLPDMDGLTATRVLKSTPDTSDIPVIAVTAFAMPDERKRVFDAGCDGCVTKPIEYGELLAEIRRAVERSRRPGRE